MVYDKKIVSHYLTQNIDNLESKAGFEKNQINHAHGANFGAYCAKCRKAADHNKLQEYIAKGQVFYCDRKVEDEDFARKGEEVEVCGGPIKPEITFFGEQLPPKFLSVLKRVDEECDLLIVIGTALAVQPFASIVTEVDDKTPKVLINMTKTENYDFDNKELHPERIFLQGKCDEVVAKISKDCGWEQEFKERIQKCKS